MPPATRTGKKGSHTKPRGGRTGIQSKGRNPSKSTTLRGKLLSICRCPANEVHLEEHLTLGGRVAEKGVESGCGSSVTVLSKRLKLYAALTSENAYRQL